MIVKLSSQFYLRDGNIVLRVGNFRFLDSNFTNSSHPLGGRYILQSNILSVLI